MKVAAATERALELLCNGVMCDADLRNAMAVLRAALKEAG